MNMFTHKNSIAKQVVSIAYIFIVCLGISSFTPSISFAADIPGKYTLLEPLPCVPGPGVNCTPGTQLENANFADYVQYMFNLIIAIAAVAAVFMIVWGGFKYTSTDSFSGKSEGKEIIFKAVQGLLMVLVSYLLLRTIDPRLVNIPSTLVKPLEYKIDKDTTAAFLFEQLAKEASKNSEEAKTAQQAAATIDEKLKVLNEDIETLAHKLKVAEDAGDTEEIARLETDIFSRMSQRTAEEVNRKLIVAESEFRTIIYPTEPSQGTGGANYKKALESVNEIYQRQFVNLQKAGADANQLTHLREYKNYSNLMIQANEQAGSVNDFLNLIGGSYVKSDAEQLEKIKFDAIEKINKIAEDVNSNDLGRGITDRDLNKKAITAISNLQKNIRAAKFGP
jgi:hypothetical protein